MVLLPIKKINLEQRKENEDLVSGFSRKSILSINYFISMFYQKVTGLQDFLIKLIEHFYPPLLATQNKVLWNRIFLTGSRSDETSDESFFVQ